MVTIWGSCGYFCMGSVRGWSSPAIPSLNRTVDFELSLSDLQWICNNFKDQFCSSLTTVKLFFFYDSFVPVARSCSRFLIHHQTNGVLRPEEGSDRPLLCLRIRFSHHRIGKFRETQIHVVRWPIPDGFRRRIYHPRLSNLRKHCAVILGCIFSNNNAIY